MGYIDTIASGREAGVSLVGNPANFSVRIAPRSGRALVLSDNDAPRRLYYVAVEEGDARFSISRDRLCAPDELSLLLSASGAGARAMFISSRNIRVETDNPEGARVYLALVGVLRGKKSAFASRRRGRCVAGRAALGAITGSGLMESGEEMQALALAHPGQVIKTDIIEPQGLSVTAAAKVLGVTRPAFSAVLNGRASVSPEMALRIEKAFGFPMELLLEMQLRYAIANTRYREERIAVEPYRAGSRPSQGDVRRASLMQLR